jgi:hypothetical protein
VFLFSRYLSGFILYPVTKLSGVGFTLMSKGGLAIVIALEYSTFHHNYTFFITIAAVMLLLNSVTYPLLFTLSGIKRGVS